MIVVQCKTSVLIELPLLIWIFNYETVLNCVNNIVNDKFQLIKQNKKFHLHNEILR